MAGAGTLARPAAAGKQAAPTVLVPFERAADEHMEQFIDVAQLIGANAVQLGPFDVPAYGYMRSVLLYVQATGGVGGAATVAAAEDAPFSAISEIALIDVNGAPIVGPFSGYDLYLANKYGGYRPISDAKQLPTFSAVAAGAGASGNFSFSLRLPTELVNRDALGAIANANASSTYKVRLTLAGSATIYTTAPATTLPTVRIRAMLEAYTQPTDFDLRGHPQATVPPAHGTTQFWSKTVANLNAGQQTIRLPRVGNYIRNLVFVFRDNTGARVASAAQFPDPTTIYWDTRPLHTMPRDVWKQIIAERTRFTNAIDSAGGLDSNVFMYDFCHEFDGQVGDELRDGYLPTVQSTRLELFGTFGAAGSLTILTNDVSPAGEIFV